MIKECIKNLSTLNPLSLRLKCMESLVDGRCENRKCDETCLVKQGLIKAEKKFNGGNKIKTGREFLEELNEELQK